MYSEKELGYKWLDINPSQEVASPRVFEFIYQETGDCAWMGRRNYTNEQLLDMEQEQLVYYYPNLFSQLELLLPQSVVDESEVNNEETTHYYYRGATIALLSLESSLSPDQHLQDITLPYMEYYTCMDGVDQAWWLFDYARQSAHTTEALRRFLVDKYRSYEDTQQLRMLIMGARNAFVIATHFLACYEREKELAWMTKDDESFSGWLAYRYGEE